MKMLFVVIFVEISTYVSFSKAGGKYKSVSQYFGCIAIKDTY
jgi:hypothetical protein